MFSTRGLHSSSARADESVLPVSAFFFRSSIKFSISLGVTFQPISFNKGRKGGGGALRAHIHRKHAHPVSP